MKRFGVIFLLSFAVCSTPLYANPTIRGVLHGCAKPFIGLAKLNASPILDLTYRRLVTPKPLRTPEPYQLAKSTNWENVENVPKTEVEKLAWLQFYLEKASPGLRLVDNLISDSSKYAKHKLLARVKRLDFEKGVSERQITRLVEDILEFRYQELYRIKRNAADAAMELEALRGLEDGLASKVNKLVHHHRRENNWRERLGAGLRFQERNRDALGALFGLLNTAIPHGSWYLRAPLYMPRLRVYTLNHPKTEIYYNRFRNLYNFAAGPYALGIVGRELWKFYLQAQAIVEAEGQENIEALESVALEAEQAFERLHDEEAIEGETEEDERDINRLREKFHAAENEISEMTPEEQAAELKRLREKYSK